MDSLGTILLLAIVIFILGMIAAYLVRHLIRQDIETVVPREVEKQLDERGVVRRRGK